MSLNTITFFNLTVRSPRAQWVKRWPTYLADRVRSPLKANLINRKRSSSAHSFPLLIFRRLKMTKILYKRTYNLIHPSIHLSIPLTVPCPVGNLHLKKNSIPLPYLPYLRFQTYSGEQVQSRLSFSVYFGFTKPQLMRLESYPRPRPRKVS